jgi:hypothetical protein
VKHVCEIGRANQPSGRNPAVFCCYNFRFAILPRRGKPRLYNEVAPCRKLCSFRIPRRSPLLPKTRFCSCGDNLSS